ncbi:uncharacterized protein [Hoplias malabaricus]|uniref:uncharacterized protein n=1 Tax=Hoplias malabaricus TaxID=27720 RepID=UPI003461F03B
MFLCATLLILSGFMKTGSEGFKLAVPVDPVDGQVGEDMVLPCSLQPSTSAENILLSWLKKNMTVHHYEHGADIPEEQDKIYRGRTALFKEELKNGNISLKLSAVQLSDDGIYTCFVEPSSGPQSAAVYVKVKYVFAAWKIAVICTLLVGLILYVVFMSRKTIIRKLTGIYYTVKANRIKNCRVRDEWDLKKYKATEEGYSKLIPAITNCTKARLDGCNLSEQLFITLRETLLSPNSSLIELDLSNNNLQGSGLEILYRGLKKLETLRLTMCNLIEESCDILQLVLKSEISCLDLSKNNLHDTGVEKLCVGLNSVNCELKTLRLALCRLGDVSCEQLSSVLPNSSLKTLELSFNDLWDSGVEKLCKGLIDRHCKLETLRLVMCKLNEGTCSTMASVLKTDKNSLKELDLSNNDLKDLGVKELCKGLEREHCKLETLRLTMCKLSEDSCVYLGLALSSNQKSTLKELDLSNNDLQNSGVEKLCEGLEKSNHKLETLRLAMCKLREGPFANLVSVLKIYKNSLKELDLSNNDLKDPGVKELCKGLESEHCKLETLRLSGCMITKEGWNSLDDALKPKQSQLKYLDLDYNHPGDTVKKDPGYWYWGILKVDYAGKNRIKPGLQKYACELTLDPNTVNTHLSLSEGNRKVERVMEDMSYRDHAERFSGWEQVLCKEELTGRCYWETEWNVGESGEGVYISVAYKSIRRKGNSVDCRFGENDKSWSLFCFNNSYSVIHNHNRTAVSSPPSSSNRVGVYVDCPAGTLSFYSVSTDTHTLTHLHTFTTTFTEPLYAGFCVHDIKSSVHFCKLE